ncbi:MAG: VOC family protein [Nannocystaceae bacterium]
MKNPPPGWPRISSSVFYEDPAAAIDFLCDAFGFELTIKIEGEGGRIEHSELVYGGGMIYCGSVGGKSGRATVLPGVSPRSLGGRVTQAMAIFVDDADAHCARARARGATIVDEPTTHDYGDDYWADRTYRAVDPEGHHWWFMQRVRHRGEAL